MRGLPRRVDRTAIALLGIAGVALLARLVVLGDRVAHWDEGRVGYDILRYMATGSWEYRPIVHGPFLPHVNRVVFELLGPTDANMRLVVAVIGGLLPLAAWLFRDRLGDAEVVALGLLLAADPILLYYSRFMRNDVLVGAFAFSALGCFVRAHDSGRRRYVIAGAGLLALAFTAKENAILYVVSVLGGLVLLLDHRLFLARGGEPPWPIVLRDRLVAVGRGLWRWRLVLLVAAVEFLAIVVLFYAPRSGHPAGFGLAQALRNPGLLPAVVEAGSVGAAKKLVDLWIAGNHQDHQYLPFLADYVEVLAKGSGALALLAGLGFVADRYGGDRPRDLVALGFYWGFVSVLGYPIVIDIRSAWAVVHAVLPLAIPAAVGGALLYRWGREAFEADDRIGVGLAALVLLLVAGQVVATGVSTSYLHPQREGNVMIQYAQPEGDLRPAVGAIEAAAADNDGLDVLWYGPHFYVENESDSDRLPVADGEWYNRLPMPWYIERADAEVTSVIGTADLTAVVSEERPPVVLTRAEEADDAAPILDGYREYRYEFRQFDEELVVFVDGPYAYEE